MNKVILMGRLTRDPEVRYPQDAERSVVARFSLAVDRKYKQQGGPDADFFNCTCFGKQAEFVEKYLKKGIKMLICGRIQNENYTNRNGERVYAVQILVDEMEFAESKSAQQNAAAQEHKSGSRQEYPTGAYPGDDGFMNIPDGIDEELPFN